MLKQFQVQLRQADLAAFLVTDPVNVRYLTGFTGDETALLVTPTAAWFISDSRFATQLRDQAPDIPAIMAQGQWFEEAVKLTPGPIGFEAHAVTVAEFQKMPKAVKWVASPDVIAQMREVKTPDEVALIKRAIAIADAGYQAVLAYVQPGMTERQVARYLADVMAEHGGEDVAFETIVASGARSAMPHGAATDKVIEAGDVITLDWGARYHGYVSDLTRTFAVGEPTEKLKEVYRVVYAANQAVKALLAPGVTGAEINAEAHRVIDAAGYKDFFQHGTGHGIGLAIHEGPGAWGPYKDVGQVIGNVETNEPGIYLPDLGGVRIEDDHLITAGGNVQLTPEAPAELLVVPVRD